MLAVGRECTTVHIEAEHWGLNLERSTVIAQSASFVGNYRVANPKRIALWISAAALLIAVVLVKAATPSSRRDSAARQPIVLLKGVGPRSTSNQTEQPLAVYGVGFKAGIRLRLGAPFDRELPLTVLDE